MAKKPIHKGLAAMKRAAERRRMASGGRVGMADGGGLDWVTDPYYPNSMAARRVANAVRPDKGRKEGAITRGLEALGTAAYDMAAAPSRLVNAHMSEYQPGMSVNDMPETMEHLPEVAMNTMGGGTGFAQPSAVGIFGGKLAKTADHAALARAEEMIGKGANRDQILNETGWFKGSDGNWRFEIPDDAARFHRSTMHPTEYNIFGNKIVADTGTASSAIRHPELFKAYPDLDFMTVVQGRGDFKGQFSPPLKSGDTGSIAMNFDRLTTEPEMRSTALHEVQHAVQNIEGFAPGANPEMIGSIKNPDVARYQSALKTEPDLSRLKTIHESPTYKAEIDEQNKIWTKDYQPRLDEIYKRGRDYTPGDADQIFKEFEAFKKGRYPLDEESDRLFKSLRQRGIPTRPPPDELKGHDAYERMVGEVESRNVQSRMNMTPQDRRSTPPWATEDIPAQKQILNAERNYAAGGTVNPFDEFDAPATPAKSANAFDEFDTKSSSATTPPPPDDHGLSERQKLSTVGKALSPITGYPETYRKMKNEALEQAGHGIGQLSKPEGAWDFAKGIGNTALGTLGYVASPINAAYRSIAGQPVEDVTGIPREYTEFAGQLATPGLGFTKLNARAPGAAPRGPSEMQPSVAGRAPVAESESANALDIPLSRGQATRDLDAIRYEDMAARGAYGPKAQEEAARFFDEQFKAIQRAGANVGETLGREGPKAADAGEAAATVNAEMLSTAEKARAVVAEAERRAAAEGEAYRGMVSDSGRTINEAVQGSGPAVSNIREVGEVVGQGVRGAADEAAQKYKGLYKEAFDLPGEFDAKTFTNIGNSIKSKITSGESPVIVDTTTPSASAALDDLGKIQGLKFANKAHVPGQEMVSAAEGPSEIVAVNLKGVDQARKLLVQRYQQAKARGRATQDFSDQRAMERIIDGFDDHIEQSIANGLFSGDERALAALQEARGAFSNYRKTFRPNPGDDVSTALNRIVSRNATPEEIGNMITGSGKIGNAGLPVRLANKLKDVLGQDSGEWSAVRQAIWQKASNVRSAAGELDAAKSARSIDDFTNSTLARTVFEPHELSAMRAQATGMRDLERVIETLPSAERANAVKSAYQQAFEVGDIGGSQATVFRRIIDGTATPQETTQAIFGAVNSSSSGNVIRTLKAIEKIVGPESDTMNAIRQGVWQKLTQNAATKDQPGQQKMAQAIGEFLNGNGRLVAKQLYSEPELALMKKYAEAVKLTVIPKYARTNSDTAPAILAAAHKYAGALAAAVGEMFGHGVTSAVTGYGVGKMLQGGINKVKDMKELNRVRSQFEPASGEPLKITVHPTRPRVPPTAAPALSSPPRLPAPALQGTMPTAAEPDQRQ